MIIFSLLTQLAFAEGKDVQIKEGQIVSGNKGDSVCYLTIKAKDGSMFSEMADRKLCYPDYKGKFSTFSWKKIKVLAKSCAGDPDCTISSSAWIIADATPIWSVSIRDNENGTSVIQAQSGFYDYAIDIPLGGCFREDKDTKNFFYKRACYFAGQGGSIGLKQSLEKGLQVVMDIHVEEGTESSIIWTEPYQIGSFFRR